MASADALLFIFCLIDGSSLLFLTVYFIITLSDLECDYINATLCCSRLNKWVVPELVAHCIIVLLQLLTWHPLLFLINFLVSGWEIHRYVTKPSGSIGIYDPTEIHNRQQLKGYMREAMVKLGFHLIFFFIYLYSMILALVAGD